MKTFICRTATIAVLAAAAGQAAAATATTTFQVDATVISTCSVSATDLAFGNYEPLAALATDSVCTVSGQCPLSTGYGVGLSVGSGAGATVSARKMTRGAASGTLTCSLYQDVSRAQVWGLTGAEEVTGTGNGLAQDLTAYGRIPAGQNAYPGSYSDVITVTVTF